MRLEHKHVDRVRLLVVSLILQGVCIASGQTKLVSAEEQIAAIRSDWCKYLHSKQLEPEMNLYAEDAVFLQPTGER